MHADFFIQLLFLIFTGAAVFATLALYARQALPAAYIALGMIIGPWGLGLVADDQVLEGMAEIGIIFLLFLLGLNLEPRELLRMLRETILVTALASLVIFGLGASIALLFGQDIIAIAVILVRQGLAEGHEPLREITLLLVAAPLLFTVSMLACRYGLMRLISRFDQVQEYIFLLAIGWCLAIAVLGEQGGLSYEIGAFTAGVAMATSPISRFIAETLKPLRDFFLIVFFFALGASFNMSLLPQIIWPVMTLATVMLLAKPLLFAALLRYQGERPGAAREIGIRLGQISEFSLLLALVGLQGGVMTAQASYIIQAATVLTFVVSTYWIVMKLPNPVAISDELRRD